jgi:hypothetical protein
MSLPARRERVLERIERSLQACDPPLRSMFAMFTKLARDEEMPRLEKLQAPSSPLWDWLKRQAQPYEGDGKRVGHRCAGHQAARDHTRPDRAAGAGTCRPPWPWHTRREPLRSSVPAAPHRTGSELG